MSSRKMPPLKPVRRPLLLAHLPLEVLSITQHFLEPIDILSLRLTCKRISSTTRDRTTWTHVLRRLCSTHGVFVPTFRFGEMTQRELEHAALVPFRFLAFLTKDDISSVRPRAIRLLVPPGQARFMELFLVSGGRYLFTQTVDGRIDLWDLGHSVASVINPSPVASLGEDDQTESSIAALEPTKDGLGMYMVIRERWGTAGRLSIYLVYPLSPTPEFVPFRVKTFIDGINYFSASPGMCGIHHGVLFTVWDYVRDLTVTWTVGRENYSLISQGCALLFDARGIKMWKIPELHASCGDVGPFEPEPNVIPVFSFQYARQSGQLYEKCMPYTAWPRGEGRTEILSYMAQAEDGPMLDYYTMETLPGNNVKLPNAIPLLRASTNICKNDIRVIPAIAGRYCGRCFFQPFTTWEDNFMVNITDPENLAQNKSVQLYKDDISRLTEGQYPNTDLYGFCPMSGRLCGLVTGGREIRVMDFILPK
ncbi:hypothetical protein E4T56_gene11899 [Termitomyces sp. T112]|nr:hypothetical protein E4T56_gene11899 [Termitomyces sp. T112]